MTHHIPTDLTTDENLIHHTARQAEAQMNRLLTAIATSDINSLADPAIRDTLRDHARKLNDYLTILDTFPDEQVADTLAPHLTAVA